MSETATPPPAEAPRRRFSWLVAALVASLALNLLVLGAAAARYFVGEPADRGPGASQMQLIPRKFFSELEGPRKRELLRLLRQSGPAFREGRRAARESVLELAAALEAEPYDAARVKSAVDGFASRSERLIGTGSEVALALIGKLTDPERKLLARHIRLREERVRGEGRAGKPSGN